MEEEDRQALQHLKKLLKDDELIEADEFKEMKAKILARITARHLAQQR